jgi:hypothetical protein
MEGRRILGLIFLLIISIHAEDSNEVKIPEQDPVKLAKPAPVKVAAPAPVKQAAPVKVAAPAPVKVAAPVKAVKAPEPIDPVVKPTPKAPEKVPQAPAEIPKARIPAAQKIQARIEEEKSIDDLSAQDQLPKIAESDYCGAAVSKLCSRSGEQNTYNCTCIDKNDVISKKLAYASKLLQKLNSLQKLLFISDFQSDKILPMRIPYVHFFLFKLYALFFSRFLLNPLIQKLDFGAIRSLRYTHKHFFKIEKSVIRTHDLFKCQNNVNTCY